MPSSSVNLLAALNDPRSLLSFTGPQWNQLARVTRRTKSMAKLAHRVGVAGLDAQLEPRVLDHLIASRVIATQHRRVVNWEADRVMAALADSEDGGYDVVFLKGAAYVLADLPAGRGRLVSDVDIMVPKPHIEDAEQRLIGHGWKAMKLDAYDQRYYRQWMHELPPLKHRDRKAVLDVHHTILPESGRLHPDAAKLFAAAVPIPGLPGVNNPRMKMLAPADMILHSAAHLFQDGDLAGGLRDLLDLDDLLRHFGETEPNFWNTLVARGKELDLHRPLYYALRFTSRLLKTPVPAEVLAQSARTGKPLPPTTLIMDLLADRAFVPDAGEGRRFGADLARWCLYVRSHWLRMPPLLLLQHLSKKALRRFGKAEDETKTKEEKDVEAKKA
jgi:hypothetical protein